MLVHTNPQVDQVPAVKRYDMPVWEIRPMIALTE